MKNILSKKRNSILIILVLFIPSLWSQEAKELPFQSGENLQYSISYKYGIMMVKAGSASYSVSEQTFRGKSSMKTSLSFKTSGMIDQMFKVRDTLYSHSSMPAMEPVFHRKHLHEGKSNYVEEIEYRQFSPSYTEIQSKRYTSSVVKFDTLLYAKTVGFDMLNIFIFARVLDYSTLKSGDSFPITSFVGKDVVPMNVRFMGQRILNKGNVKYKTLLFEIDIIDKAFETAKTSMEMWVSDDKNRVPVKLRAKLKIGAAEAELTSTKNLKYPFDAKIQLK